MADMIGEDVTVKILITVHRDTRTLYKKAAAKYGVNMSEWVRAVCDDAAVKALKDFRSVDDLRKHGAI